MSQRIERGFSLYLDLIRLMAALIVMFGHAQISGLINLHTNALLDLAPSAVIVFFVLSGYIIDATTDRAAGFRRYAVHRTARIYSVVIPAVLLSFALAASFAELGGGASFHSFERDWMQWWRVPAVLGFQGEDWFQVIEVPWNGPFWSLHYEVFYYALYAALTFAAGRRRIWLALAIGLLAGPKILLLLPCWWLGVEIARRPDLGFPSRRFAWGVLLTSPVLVVGLALSHLPWWVERHLVSIEPGLWKFDHSALFITDYMAALLVGAGFVAARQLSFGPSSLLVRAGKPVAWAAGMTFSIYLFHRPLQELASQFFQLGSGTVVQAVLVQAAILLTISGLAAISERRTLEWRRMLGRFIEPRKRVSDQARPVADVDEQTNPASVAR